MRLVGRGGSITAGPRRTAWVQAWHVAQAGAGAWDVSFAPADIDSFLWTQGPQTVSLDAPLSDGSRRAWTWSVPMLPALGPMVTVRVVGAPH